MSDTNMQDSVPAKADSSADPALQVAEQPKTETKKYKVKVDGVEAEVDESELVNSYQKGRSADKKFQEAADLRKQMEAFVENVRAQPELLFEHLGLNPDNWAHQRLVSKLEKEAEEAILDPRDKKIAELEKKFSEIEKGNKDKREKEEAQRMSLETQEIAQKLDRDIAETFEAMGVTKPTVEMVADLAEQMLIEYKANKKQLHPKDAFSRAKTSFSNRFQSYAKNSPEALLEFMPEEALDKIAETYLARRKSKEVPLVRGQQTPTVKSPEEKISKELNEFFKRRN